VSCVGAEAEKKLLSKQGLRFLNIWRDKKQPTEVETFGKTIFPLNFRHRLEYLYF